jgi:hypothetical protein
MLLCAVARRGPGLRGKKAVNEAANGHLRDCIWIVVMRPVQLAYPSFDVRQNTCTPLQKIPCQSGLLNRSFLSFGHIAGTRRRTAGHCSVSGMVAPRSRICAHGIGILVHYAASHEARARQPRAAPNGSTALSGRELRALAPA